VDADVDLYQLEAVEWAIATRVQGDRDVVILSDQPSSSLDPSALRVPGAKARTAKVGIDATVHWDTPSGPTRPEDWQALDYEPIDPAPYLGDEGRHA